MQRRQFITRLLHSLHPWLVAVMVVAYLTATIGYPVPIRRHADAEPGTSAVGTFPCQGRACGCSTADQCRKACCCFKERQVLQEETTSSSCCAEGAGEKQQPLKVSWIQGIQAQQCHGLATYWSQAGATLPPATPAGMDWQQRVVGRIVSEVEQPVRIPKPPDPLPPRAC